MLTEDKNVAKNYRIRYNTGIIHVYHAKRAFTIRITRKIECGY